MLFRSLESHQDLRKVSYIITTPIQATNPLPCHIVGNKRVCTNPATNQLAGSGLSGDVGPSNGKYHSDLSASTNVFTHLAPLSTIPQDQTGADGLLKDVNILDISEAPAQEIHTRDVNQFFLPTYTVENNKKLCNCKKCS